MEVVQGHQFPGARLDPAVARLRLTLGAVAIATGVEGEAEIMAAPDALVPVPAERRRAAALDGTDHLVLRPGDTGAAALDKSPDAGAENVGQLEGGPTHDADGSPSVRLSSPRVSSGFGASRNFRVARWR